MTAEKYGCACCSGGFHRFVSRNKVFQSMRAEAESGNGWSCNWGIDFSSVSRRNFIKAVGAASLTAILPGCSREQEEASKQDQATTVFTAGRVLTVDADFSEAEAIAVRGNRILAVGSDAEVREAAGDGAKIVDLRGRTVLPGFVDPHAHVIAGSIVDGIMDYVGMARFQTTDEVLAHIRQRAAETPAGDWLVFRNFDPAVQEGVDRLTFAELDPISTDHPIFVLNASGHLAYANSKAFEVSGIANDVLDPPGGEFVRDADGNLTGFIKNNVAFLQIASNYPWWRPIRWKALSGCSTNGVRSD